LGPIKVTGNTGHISRSTHRSAADMSYQGNNHYNVVVNEQNVIVAEEVMLCAAINRLVNERNRPTGSEAPAGMPAVLQQ
jgi:hypothetical protein